MARLWWNLTGTNQLWNNTIEAIVGHWKRPLQIIFTVTVDLLGVIMKLQLLYLYILRSLQEGECTKRWHAGLSVRHSLCWPEDLSSDPRHPCHRRGKAAYAYHPRSGKVEQRSLVLAGRPASLAKQNQGAPVRGCLNNYSRKWLRELPDTDL